MQNTKFYKDDLVCVLFPAHCASVGKLKHKWRGPYKIIEVDVGFDNVEVIEMATRKRRIVHISFLQPYYVQERVLMSVIKKMGDFLEPVEMEIESEFHVSDVKMKRNASGRNGTLLFWKQRWCTEKELFCRVHQQWYCECIDL